MKKDAALSRSFSAAVFLLRQETVPEYMVHYIRWNHPVP
jgi:hypothetical protein